MAKNNGGFLLGAIVGGIAGAVATLLLTSKKGKQWIAEMNESGKLEPVKTTATEWLEVAKEKTKEVTKFIPIGKADSQRASSEAEAPSISVSAADETENIEKLLREAEEAFDDAEQKLQRQNETE
uniref:YtxH domain-containing protein n=1 Tax=Geobacillus sp. (strain Y4.1MC1) TaxID=581103 RepID=A0A7U3YDE6_GEOS0